MVDYRVEIEDPHAHLFHVTLTLKAPAPLQAFSLPVWAPGSYLVRDFVRHLSFLRARQGDQPREVVASGKSSWQVACEGSTALRLDYRVYAFDPSVRGAFLDSRRGFFNGSSLFLRAGGRESAPHRLRLGRLPAAWQVATAMRSSAPGCFEAADHDELIDHPFELGRFWRGSFVAGRTAHELVVSGALPDFDGARLLAETRRLCEATLAFWQPRGKPPFERYLFLIQARDDGEGGLEHRDSAALLCARRDLPRLGDGGALGDGAVNLLSLIVHEYFHAWSVKRLRPAEHLQLDLSQEQPSRLLWFFEGFTTYYDELLLRRSGTIDAARYLHQLAGTINTVLATPGRHVQSLAEASFDAWTRSYKPDENTPNATVSYYAKGALLALVLDLTLRCRAAATLDDVMRLLWQRHRDSGLSETDIDAAVQTVAGVSLRAELDDWVHGTGDLPLRPLLEQVGVSWHEQPASLARRFGMRLSEGPVSGVQVRQVLRGSAAEKAGVAAGDELLALDGWRLRRLEDARSWWRGDSAAELLLVRDGRVQRITLQPPDEAAAATVSLALAETPTPQARALRQAWLAL